MMVLGYGEKVNHMTDRAEIERLLNQTGRTLEGLPSTYDTEFVANALRGGKNGWTIGGYICHQSDVIELLIGALRDALEKPMQKPLTLEEVGKLGLADIWEERRKPHRLMKAKAAYVYRSACQATQDKSMAEVFGYNTEIRAWITVPIEKEMEAAAWES